MDLKTFQPSDILAQILGSRQQTDSNTTGTADVGALRGVYGQAMKPMDQQLYNNLIQSIFQKASENVPGITQQLANATGSRVGGNSALALALNEQNNQAARDAAGAILGQQNKQLDTANSAANGIATNTRGQNQQQTQTTGMGINPLVALLGGSAMNMMDKKGVFERAGTAVSGAFDNFFGSNNTDMGPMISSPSGPANASKVYEDFTGPTGINDTVSNFFGGNNGASTLASVGSGAGDLLGSAWDSVKSFGSGISDFLGFADGGLPYNHPHMRMYLNNGNNDIIDPMVGSFNRYSDGGPVDPTVGYTAYADGGFLQRGHNYQLPPAYNDMAEDKAEGEIEDMPSPSASDILVNILHSRNIMDARPLQFADGGVIRNRNNMGGPLIRRGMNAQDTGMFDSSYSSAGAGSANADSVAANDLIQRILAEVQSNSGEAGKSRSGSGRGDLQPQDRMSSMSGSLNKGMGDPQSAALKPYALSAAAGMVHPLLGMMVGMANGLGPTEGGMGGLGRAAIGTVRRNMQAESALNASSDPLGSFIAALSATGSPDAPSFNGSQMAEDVSSQAVKALALVNPGMPGTAPAGNPQADALVNSVNQFTSSGGGNGFMNSFKGTDAGSFNGTQGDGNASSTSDSNNSTSTAADGGLSSGVGFIRGRGTGTSDSISARSKTPGSPDISLSNGEGIIPADVIQAVGWDHFQSLIDTFHTPVRR